MAKNRTQLFQDLNVDPTNSRWSWCAKNTTIKRAVFTLWEDKENPTNTWLIHDDEGSYKRPGYNDQKKILNLAIKNDFETLGIICIAKDVNAIPRSIREVRDDLIYKVKIKIIENKIYLQKLDEFSLIEIIRKDKDFLNNNNGLQDLDTQDLGSDFPDRAKGIGYIIKRDKYVRKAVLLRAFGKCEYCGSTSFQTGNGENYLETHHIIYLANKGVDRVSNVIALCPQHHREAHFGKNAEELEKEFLKIISSKI